MTWATARAWLAGRLTDAQIVLEAPLVPEGVFFVNLPGLPSYRAALERIAALKARGAVFMVLRTGNPVIEKHFMEKNPGQRFFVELDGRARYLAPPAGFAAWTAKFSAGQQFPRVQAIWQKIP